MPKTTSEKIIELQAAQARLAERLKAEKMRLRSTERRDENRRKIIVGAVIREHMKRDADFAERVQRVLMAHVVRAADREILGLVPERGGLSANENPPEALSGSSGDAAGEASSSSNYGA